MCQDAFALVLNNIFTYEARHIHRRQQLFLRIHLDVLDEKRFLEMEVIQLFPL